jgi:hypothetical protein
MEHRMHEDGVRMMFIDAARSNTTAVKFFKRMGYGKPETEVWMSKLIQGAQKRRTTPPDETVLPKRFRKTRRPKKAS